MIDIPAIAAASLSHVNAIVNHYLPGGRQSGPEYVCADLSGGKGDSTSVNTMTGKWADFATGDKGGDLVSLVAASLNCSQLDAARELAEFIGQGNTSVTPPKAVRSETWKPITPVPADAPPAPKEHYKHGVPVAVETYRDRSGRVLYYEHRYESPSPIPGRKNDKAFAPLTYCRSESGKLAWRFQAIPNNRPLLGQEYVGDDTTTALICEGGKAAGAGRRLVGDKVVVLTWSGGSNAVDKTDFSPLRGLHVYVWPDADKPGGKAGLAVADAAIKAGAQSVHLVMPPPDVVEGFDLADAEAEGWTAEQVVTCLKASVSPEEFKRAIEYQEAVNQKIDEPPTKPEPRLSLFVSANAMLAESIQLRYLVKNVIELGTTGLVFGPSGHGKTFYFFDGACCVASGLPWNGHDCKQGIVLYCTAEGFHGFPRRMRAWLKNHPGANLSRLFVSRSAIGFDCESIQQVIAEVRALEEQTGEKVALIVIDTLNRHLDGDENSTRDMSAFIKGVDGLRAMFPDSVAAIIHHSGHGTETAGRARGSSALRAAMDFEWQIKDGLATCTKQKDGPQPEPVEFKLVPVEIGLDDDGEPITSCVVQYGERSQANRKPKLTADEQSMVDAVTTSPTHIDTLRATFYERKRVLDPTAKQDSIRKAFKRTIEQLETQGLLHIDGNIVQAGQTGQSRTNPEMSGGTRPDKPDTLLKKCPGVRVPVRSDATIPDLGYIEGLTVCNA